MNSCAERNKSFAESDRVGIRRRELAGTPFLSLQKFSFCLITCWGKRKSFTCTRAACHILASFQSLLEKKSCEKREKEQISAEKSDCTLQSISLTSLRRLFILPRFASSLQLFAREKRSLDEGKLDDIFVVREIEKNESETQLSQSLGCESRTNWKHFGWKRIYPDSAVVQRRSQPSTFSLRVY